MAPVAFVCGMLALADDLLSSDPVLIHDKIFLTITFIVCPVAFLSGRFVMKITERKSQKLRRAKIDSTYS
jgi:hypothetical protein